MELGLREVLRFIFLDLGCFKVLCRGRHLLEHLLVVLRGQGSLYHLLTTKHGELRLRLLHLLFGLLCLYHLLLHRIGSRLVHDLHLGGVRGDLHGLGDQACVYHDLLLLRRGLHELLLLGVELLFMLLQGLLV